MYLADYTTHHHFHQLQLEHTAREVEGLSFLPEAQILIFLLRVEICTLRDVLLTGQ